MGGSGEKASESNCRLYVKGASNSEVAPIPNCFCICEVVRLVVQGLVLYSRLNILLVGDLLPSFGGFKVNRSADSSLKEAIAVV